MPIAAKLLYFQRRRPPPLPEPTDPLSRDSSAARLRVHHRSSYEVVRGSHRERGASSGCTTESTRKTLSSTRQSSNASDDRLPDAVQQAKERLHQRLRSDLFPGRRSTSACGSQRWQTAPARRTIWDGPSISSESDICTSEDGRLNDRTTGLSSRGSLSAHKVKQMTAEIFSDTTVAAPHPRHVSELGHGTLQGTIEGKDSAESSVDCSICLEGCHGAAGGLIQLRCKHIFHSACLEQWLQSRADCPYCRAGVVLPRKE